MRQLPKGTQAMTDLGQNPRVRAPGLSQHSWYVLGEAGAGLLGASGRVVGVDGGSPLFPLSPAFPPGAKGGAAGILSPLVVIHPPSVPPQAWGLFLKVPREGTALLPGASWGRRLEAGRVGEEQGQPTSRGCFLPGVTLAVPAEVTRGRIPARGPSER